MSKSSLIRKIIIVKKRIKEAIANMPLKPTSNVKLGCNAEISFSISLKKKMSRINKIQTQAARFFLFMYVGSSIIINKQERLATSGLY